MLTYASDETLGEAPVQASVLYGLGNMGGREGLDAGKIGYGSGDLEDAVVGPGAQAEPVNSGLTESLRLRIQLTEALQEPSRRQAPSPSCRGPRSSSGSHTGQADLFCFAFLHHGQAVALGISDYAAPARVTQGRGCRTTSTIA